MPPFDREQIQDSEQDWNLTFPLTRSESVYRANNMSECKLLDKFGEGFVPSPEIEGVSYLSNGTTLNATLWLSGLAGNYTDDFNNYSFNYREFLVGFTIPSVFGSRGDYGATISTNDGVNWTGSWIERGPRSAIRTHISDNIIKDPIEGKNYVRFIVPLDKMNNPKEFMMSFSDTNWFELNKKSCRIVDRTPFVPVPPPEFTFSVKSNPLIVRPGDESTVQLRVNSTSSTSTHAFFNLSDVEGIEAKLLANDTSIPPNGVASVPLRLKVSDQAQIRPYTVQVFAKIFLPTTTVSSLSGVKFNNPLALNTSKQTDLTIQVLPPLQWDEKISNFWTHLGSPITFVYGIIAVSVPWLLNELRKKYKKNKGESDSNREGAPISTSRE